MAALVADDEVWLGAVATLHAHPNLSGATAGSPSPAGLRWVPVHGHTPRFVADLSVYLNREMGWSGLLE